MREFIISTDSTVDLPKSFIEENKIAIHPLNYIVDEVEYGVELDEMKPEDFYRGMREGKMPTTCASNPEYITGLMMEQVRLGYDVLHISFSSALSSSYNNATMSANRVMEEVEGSKIIVVDSLSATAGQALLVVYAVEMKKQGASLEEISDWLIKNRTHFVHHFIVDDLHHLVRGGRLKKSSAIIGTALQIKPLLHMNNQGELEPMAKLRGRKKALRTLTDSIGDNMLEQKISTVFISHADCYEDAKSVAEQIKDTYGIDTVPIVDITPTIGAHTGVGCIVISYFGKIR
ncbi:MAG: DegV family protein [bacterium]|nr:DegV family protein [bacterium]